MVIFIPGNVPSLKNSKVKTARGIFPSKTVTKYLRSLGIQAFSSKKKTVKGYVDKNKPNVFDFHTSMFIETIKDKETPYKIGFHFVRDSKRNFDFHNAVQIIADLMVAHNWIPDDDMTCFVPIPFRRKGKWYTVDKDNPGVYIKIY